MNPSRCLACGIPHRTHGRRCKPIPHPALRAISDAVWVTTIGVLMFVWTVLEILIPPLVLVGFSSLVLWTIASWLGVA